MKGRITLTELIRYTVDMIEFLEQLDTLLKNRKALLPEGSYTTSLFEGGLDRILRKVGEESGEVIIAAKNQDRDELKNEVADLLYHVMVLLHDQGLSLSDVSEQLSKRHSDIA